MGVVSLLPPAMETESKGIDDPVAGVDGMSLGMDDPHKKIRKPYTITKSRQNWTEIEHDKFLEALHLFDRDWKKIEAFVGTKTAIQIRSHAQKYFLKVQKSGANEHVPPPRPKRKAAHPYPHKAPPKNAVPKVGVLRPCPELIEPVDVSHNCCSSSIESGPAVWVAGESDSQRTAERERVVPDFAKVYRFIGSVFDPCESNHLQKLKMMDPVDVETAVLLMRNLCANLKSPQFEGYRRLFSSYDADTGGRTAAFSPFGGLRAMPANAITSS